MKILHQAMFSACDFFCTPVNGTPGSQLSTPRSGKSPSPSPTSPGSLRKQKVRERMLLVYGVSELQLRVIQVAQTAVSDTLFLSNNQVRAGGEQ